MRTSLAASVIALAALCLTTPDSSPVQAVALSRIESVTTTHGVRLTLTLGRRSYPQNALVRVTLTVTNITRHTVSLDGSNPPRVDVVDAQGNDVYIPWWPFGSDAFFIPSGPRRPAVPLPAGRSIRTHLYLVLLGPELVPSLFLAQGRVVTGHKVRLRLVPGQIPQVTIHPGPRPSATIAPVAGSSGKLHVVQQSRCTADGGQLEAMDGWRAQATSNIAAIFPDGCDPAGSRKWEALAGWLNEPVITVRYSIP